MPETVAAAKTTTPRRTRAKAATPKATPPAKAATPDGKTTAATEDDTQVITVTLEYLEDTKRYAKFGIPLELNAAGIAGQIYVPHGTDTVKLRIEGPSE
jgi:hypothetical protein